jgi:hypothetical protein
MKIVPGTYRHYKGKLYEVLGEGRHSETLDELVFYRALYISDQFPDTFLWVRPKTMFMESVIVDGQAIPRFQLIQ